MPNCRTTGIKIGMVIIMMGVLSINIPITRLISNIIIKIAIGPSGTPTVASLMN